MKNLRSLSGKSLLLFGTFVVVLFLVACSQSKPSGSAPAPVTRQLANETTVFIQFEGPWAFAPDPQDANGIIAIAPKAPGHRDLFIKASNDQILAPGSYGLSLPVAGAGAGTLDPGVVQAQITPAGLQHALDAKTMRYAIRLPKPDAYIAAGRAESRAGTSYPPPPPTQDNHVTAVSLRYTVGNLTGFTLSGMPDSGTFNPLLLNVETPLVRIVIEPDQMDDPLDQCETHSRQSFRDLVKLLGITFFVDFPRYTAACQQNDPQQGANQQPQSIVDRVAALLRGDPSNQKINSAGVFSLSFFAHSTVDCRAPVLVLHF